MALASVLDVASVASALAAATVASAAMAAATVASALAAATVVMPGEEYLMYLSLMHLKCLLDSSFRRG